MAFSLTTTINTFFGSLVMVPETGVILNNQMNGKYFLGKLSVVISDYTLNVLPLFLTESTTAPPCTPYMIVIERGAL